MNYIHETSMIYLCKSDAEHAPDILEFCNDKGLLDNWLLPDELPVPRSLDNVCEYLQSVSQAQNVLGYTIIDKIALKAIGVIELTLDTVSRVGSVGILISKTYRRKGIGTDLVKYCTEQLFNSFNMNKVTLTVYSFNEAIKLYENVGYKEEARLKHSIFRNGNYHDIVYMSMFVDSFRAKFIAK